MPASRSYLDDDVEAIRSHLDHDGSRREHHFAAVDDHDDPRSAPTSRRLRRHAHDATRIVVLVHEHVQQLHDRHLVDDMGSELGSRHRHMDHEDNDAAYRADIRPVLAGRLRAPPGVAHRAVDTSLRHDVPLGRRAHDSAAVHPCQRVGRRDTHIERVSVVDGCPLPAVVLWAAWSDPTSPRDPSSPVVHGPPGTPMSERRRCVRTKPPSADSSGDTTGWGNHGGGRRLPGETDDGASGPVGVARMVEGRPVASSSAVRARMQRTGRRDTAAERAVRRGACQPLRASRHRCGSIQGSEPRRRSCGRTCSIGPSVSMMRPSAALAEWKP